MEPVLLPERRSSTMKTACIIIEGSHATLAYAAGELRSFLDRTTNLRFVDAMARSDYRFTLAKDAALPATCYAIRVARAQGCTEVVLAGHEEAGVLHAVYAMLDTCGVHFDILGPMLPERLDLSALTAGENVTIPFVRKRGIRQHINFPMDISSYPLAEALEYVHNMARMGMNHISFHSYSGQWFGYEQDGKYIHGGNFFYGTRLDLPDRPPFKGNIRNRSVYCIPEIEAVVDQPERRSVMASEWLNAVIAECKLCGMHVQLSIEPPGKTDAEGVAICREVLTLYPAIDTFELITPECGNSERTLSADEIRDDLVELFGEGVLADETLVASLKDNLHQLEGGLRNFARNLRIVEQLLAAPGQDLPAMTLGAYITCPDALRVLHSVMHRYTPADVSLAFLPAHGARRAVTNLRQMDFSRQSIGRSMLYGWIEFDGNMYLQQNSVTGAKQLLEFAKELTGTDQVAGAALNHWRTAENRVCIAYAAKAFIHGPIDPVEFYRQYARAFGLEDAGRFASIMQELDELDDLSREKMFNIGFCVNGCWIRPGLRWTRRWDNDAIDEAIQRYRAVIDEMEMCLDSAVLPAGRELLRFLANRVECTQIQLQCARMMKGLAEFCDHEHPDRLTAAQKQEVAETCDRAMSLAQSYLATHAEAIVDRGCEGTLISYQTTIPNYIEHIRAVFVDGEQTCHHLLQQLDEPPAPTTVES